MVDHWGELTAVSRAASMVAYWAVPMASMTAFQQVARSVAKTAVPWVVSMARLWAACLDSQSAESTGVY